MMVFIIKISRKLQVYTTVSAVPTETNPDQIYTDLAWEVVA